MGRAKKTRKFGEVKRVIGQRDARLQKNKDKANLIAKRKEAEKQAEVVRSIPQQPLALFCKANTALVAPFRVLIDTSFLSSTVRAKLPLLETMMDCLAATCRPVITDCIIAELEKLGPKFRIALRIARDERWERLKCTHNKIYGDDCIFDEVVRHRIYLVATSDRELKQRIRKVPGVPLLSVARGKYLVEGLHSAPVS